MTLNFVLLATVGTLIATGVYLFPDRSLARMFVGLLLIGNDINLLVPLGSGSPGQPSIRDRKSFVGDVQADSLPQAFILTAAAISMGVTTFLLALFYRQHRYRTGDHAQDDYEGRSLAQRRASDPSAAPDHDRFDDPTAGCPVGAGDNFDLASFEKPVTPPSNAPGGDDDDG